MSDSEWYILYTMPKLERKVYTNLTKDGLEAFLPFCNVMRQWSDRKKTVQVPLFPNYIFVKLQEKQRNIVFYINGVVRYICTEGHPCKVSQSVIDSIKIGMSSNPEISSEPFVIGQHVKVCSGPLSGLVGVLVERKGKNKLAINLEGIQKVIMVDVLATQLELVIV
ncbi:UpxY family transcription antiterminator [soil metagenome]